MMWSGGVRWEVWSEVVWSGGVEWSEVVWSEVRWCGVELNSTVLNIMYYYRRRGITQEWVYPSLTARRWGFSPI